MEQLNCNNMYKLEIKETFNSTDHTYEVTLDINGSVKTYVKNYNEYDIECLKEQLKEFEKDELDIILTYLYYVHQDICTDWDIILNKCYIGKKCENDVEAGRAFIQNEYNIDDSLIFLASIDLDICKTMCKNNLNKYGEYYYYLNY